MMTLIKRHILHRQKKGRTNILWLLIMAAFFVFGYYHNPCHGFISDSTSVSDSFFVFKVKDSGSLTADTIPSLVRPLVLCYHQVRDWVVTDSRNAKTYIVSPQQFCGQMQKLYDSGYHTILPDQWLDHLQYGTILPEKPFLLTFDDDTESQFQNALPCLDRYGFKAVFFVMTVTLDKDRYMSRKQVLYLSDHGHQIGCHTWDHHDVRGYGQTDWHLQLEQPTHLLEQLTGKPVRYFAYPFGLWNMAAIFYLKTQNYRAAFQLGGPADLQAPAFTITRLLVDGHWSSEQLMKVIVSFSIHKF